MTLMTACATSQAPPATLGAGAPHAASSAPAPAAAAGSPAPAGGSSDGLDQELIKEGYKPAQHDGMIYYCKTVQLSGARYPVNRCYTAAQIRRSEQEVREELNHLHLPAACHGMGCS